MKIKKHGKIFNKELPVHIEKFKCDSCGCEFTCKDDEYYVHTGGADWNYGSNSITSMTYTICSTIKDYLVCSCPECHKIVKKIRERKNDFITTTTTPLTVNPIYTIDKHDNGLNKWTITCNTIGKTESTLL